MTIVRVILVQSWLLVIEINLIWLLLCHAANGLCIILLRLLLIDLQADNFLSPRLPCSSNADTILRELCWRDLLFGII